ncbi:monovalent cation/H(+) antiporter subunit G [Streptomyces sp. TRM72054]|uniref:monovalent cation/H(+) antiporter subunit G n=1 Tax=Streptomyces sp. TRM72054 TaxID=2870562 RepID=UPI001C8BE048|nr:monovalent cation/H(+) antiporter subunit G [Streptomyces sp. TRM72054]MBX9394203.1 monovalent cation/H(+) antiporter subunit G [Streptomyces sp. TRM72054]
MTLVLDAVTAVLFTTGAAFCLLGALGLLRFPDTVSRLHAAAKAQTLGLLLILVGAAAQAPARHAPVLLLVALSQLLTTPITSQIIGRTAYRTHGLDRDLLLRDELADRLAREGTPLQGRDRPERDEDAER